MRWSSESIGGQSAKSQFPEGHLPPVWMLFLVSAVCLKIDKSCTFHQMHEVGVRQKDIYSDTVPV